VTEKKLWFFVKNLLEVALKLLAGGQI